MLFVPGSKVIILGAPNAYIESRLILGGVNLSYLLGLY